MKLKTVTVKWKKTNLTKLQDMKANKNEKRLENSRFYAFSRGKNVLFIGFAYNMDIWDEAIEIIGEDEIKSRGLLIWLGKIVESDYGRITTQLVRDVRNLMIYVEQPYYNKLNKKEYNGRANLKIRTRSFKNLRPCIRVEKGNVYKSC